MLYTTVLLLQLPELKLKPLLALMYIVWFVFIIGDGQVMFKSETLNVTFRVGQDPLYTGMKVTLSGYEKGNIPFTDRGEVFFGRLIVGCPSRIKDMFSLSTTI